MLVQLPLPLSLAPEAAVCMTRGSWLCCAYRSREDWHVPDFCCPLKHISGLLCGIDRIIMGGEQGQPQDKRGFQSGTAWVSVFTCHYVVYEGVCVCVCVTLSVLRATAKSRGCMCVCTLTLRDEVCAWQCARMGPCEFRAPPARPPSSQLPGQRSVGGH